MKSYHSMALLILRELYSSSCKLDSMLFDVSDVYGVIDLLCDLALRS